MNGNITADGITRDLEAMHKVGVGGFQIFQAGTGIPKGPVNYGSPEHLRLLQHAAKEAERLGLEFDMQIAAGRRFRRAGFGEARPPDNRWSISCTGNRR